jgi:hypothetical protein
MRYLVTGSEGPGFASPEETISVLEKIVIPSFAALTALEARRKIVAGGLPLGDRAFVFIVDAKSNEEVDALLRDLPMWGVLKWQVTPLQSFTGRARIEREAVRTFKASARLQGGKRVRGGKRGAAARRRKVGKR